MCTSARDMNQWLVQFFVLSILILVVPCLCTNDDVSAKVDNKEETKLTVQNFPYVVNNETKKSCTLADMAINITIPYKTADSKNTSSVLQVPRSLTTSGTCLSTISEMKLSWNEGKEDPSNVIRFTLINDHTNFSVFSIDMNIYLDQKNFANAAGEVHWYNATSNTDLHLFAASTTNEMYKCNETQTIKMRDADMKIGDVSLIAFNTGTDISSRKEKKYKEDELRTFPYVSKNKQNNICAFARMTISMNVSYTTKDMKQQKIATISVPTNAKAVGNCDSASSVMELIWTANTKTKTTYDLGETENSLKFGFVRDKKYSYLSYVIGEIYMDETHFPDAAEQGGRLTVAAQFEGKLFSALANNGLYSCAGETTLNATKASITVSDILLVAFDVDKVVLSKRVTDCTLSEESFKYVVRNPETTVPCVLANMDIDINVFYKKSDKSQANVTITVPEGEATGNCGSKRSELTISWPATKDEKTTNSIAFRIASNSTFFFVYEIEARIYMDEKIFPDAVEKKTTKKGTTDVGVQLFAAPAKNGLYNCQSAVQPVKADDIDISISDVAFIAFNIDETINSREVQTCPDPSNTATTTEVSSIPAPDPSVKDYHYVVSDSKTHVACIVANMEISIKIPYKTKSNKTKETTLKVPTTASTNGKCGESFSTMELSWAAGEPKDNPKYEIEQNVVTISFNKSQSAYFLKAIGLIIYLDEKQFPDAAEEKYNATVDNIDAFVAKLKNFYRCDPATSMKVKNAGIIISKVKLIAFNTEKSVASRTEENCVTDEDEGADVGAIVGGIIGGIILIGVIVTAIMMYRKRRGNM